MASFRKRGKSWYYRYTDSDGGKHERRGCPDKRATEQMAAAAELEAAKIRGGLIDPKEIAFHDHAVRPLSENLDEWQQDMMAKGKTAKHADQYRDRAGKLLAIIKGTNPSELETGRKADPSKRVPQKLATVLGVSYFTDITPEAIQAALASLRDFGKASQTANHYRAAIRAFLRWSFDKRRVRENPMRGVAAFNVEEDIRHARRSLTDDELERLVRSAESGPVRYLMPGPLRAMAYRVATSTGFRVDKLRSLTPESFRLDDFRTQHAFFAPDRCEGSQSSRSADCPGSGDITPPLAQGQDSGRVGLSAPS